MPDIRLVSLATTPGLVRSDESFAATVRAAGATCELTRVRIGSRAARLRRHIALTDLVEALAARHSAQGISGRAIVFSTVTAAFFQRPDAPYAVRFDSPAALNRPGLAGAWQRAAERRALSRARLLIPLSEAAEAAVPRSAHPPAVRVPIPIEEVPPVPQRDIDAVTYAGYPRKRGLEIACAAWAAARPAAGRLVVGGADREKGTRWLARRGVAEPPGVEWAGELPRERWLELVGRAQVFLNASRWEDFGLAPLEALSAGTLLATVPTPGPFAALPLARELAGPLVARDLTVEALSDALRAAFGMGESERNAYRKRAQELLLPFREPAIERVVRERVLPALGIRVA